MVHRRLPWRDTGGICAFRAAPAPAAPPARLAALEERLMPAAARLVDRVIGVPDGPQLILLGLPHLQPLGIRGDVGRWLSRLEPVAGVQLRTGTDLHPIDRAGERLRERFLRAVTERLTRDLPDGPDAGPASCNSFQVE